MHGVCRSPPTGVGEPIPGARGQSQWLIVRGAQKSSPGRAEKLWTLGEMRGVKADALFSLLIVSMRLTRRPEHLG